jgi:hypothetical protein
LKRRSSGVRRTWWTTIGPSSRRVVASGLVSIKTGGALVRGRHGFSVAHWAGGSTICPARCSHKRSPRHTPSHGVPFGWVHGHASHTLKDNARRLRPGCAAMRARRLATSASVIVRPR